jgi:hypothetical chaperone protein
MRMSRIGLGIDFGTSNSLVATFDGDRVTLIRLEHDDHILPTATYVDRAFKTCTGQAAIDAYIENNTGRSVELAPEVIGRAEILIEEPVDELSRAEPRTASFDTVSSAQIDLNARGRLFRGVKRMLGDPDRERVVVFERAFRLVALMTPVLLRIRQAAARQVGFRVSDPAVFGFPVHYEGRADRGDALARRRYAEAIAHAGFRNARYLPEPAAATVSYLRQRDDAPELLLTFDFGGGTLDLCLARRTTRSFTVLAHHGIALGGDHIDQRLFECILFPLLGKGSSWRRPGTDRVIETRFPFERYEQALLNWTMTFMLNQGRFRGPVVARMRQGGADAICFERLNDLIAYNYGYLVFQALRDLKAQLSAGERGTLDLPMLDIEVTITRAQFDAMTADLIAQAARAVDDVLTMARVDASGIDVVVTTGGSSLLPSVRALLDARFDERVVAHDPFTSVAAGLAIASMDDRMPAR